MKISVNNKEIDYFNRSNFPFVLFLDSFFPSQLNERGGEKTYTVQLPNTSKNTLVFGLNDYQTNFEFYSNIDYNCIVEDNNETLFKGKITINSYDKDIIECSFISFSINWISLIGQRRLRDIESFADYAFIGINTIIDNWDAQIVNEETHSSNFDVCFPLVAYGNFYVPYLEQNRKYIDTSDTRVLTGLMPSFTYNNGGSDVVAPGVPNNNADTSHFEFEDFPPCFYVANIVKKLFEDIGYFVSGTWINDSETRKLILPVTGLDDVFYNWQTLCDYTYESTNISTVISDQTNYQINSFGRQLIEIGFTAGNQYAVGYTAPTSKIDSFLINDKGFNFANPLIFNDFFVPEDGDYEFTYEYDLDILNWGLSAEVFPLLGFFLIETTTQPDLIESIEKLTFTAPITYTINPFASKCLIDNNSPADTFTRIYFTAGLIGLQNVTGSKTFQTTLKRGQIVRLQFLTTNFPATLLTQNYTFNSLNLSVKNISGDIDFKIAKNLPDMSQIDFIKSLIAMFNLYFTVDEVNKAIYFEKRDNFYLPKNNNLDLTKYCSLKNARKTPNDIPKRYRFKYSSDTSDFLVNLNPIASNFDKTNDYKTLQEDQIIETKFSDTRMQRFNFVVNVNKASTQYTVSEFFRPRMAELLTIEIPMIADEEHYNCPCSGPDFATWTYNYVPRILKINGFHDFGVVGLWLRTTIPDFPLNESMVQRFTFPRCEFEGLEWSNLYENYKNIIETLLFGHSIFIDVALNSNLYKKILVNKLIMIEGVLFYVKSIQYNPTSKSPSQLELVLSR